MSDCGRKLRFYGWGRTEFDKPAPTNEAEIMARLPHVTLAQFAGLMRQSRNGGLSD